MMMMMMNLLTYGHQICIAGASDVVAPTDRFTVGLTYFPGFNYMGQNVKNKIFSQLSRHQS